MIITMLLFGSLILLVIGVVAFVVPNWSSFIETAQNVITLLGQFVPSFVPSVLIPLLAIIFSSFLLFKILNR